jgi:hypothetical protein
VNHPFPVGQVGLGDDLALEDGLAVKHGNQDKEYNGYHMGYKFLPVYACHNVGKIRLFLVNAQKSIPGSIDRKRRICGLRCAEVCAVHGVFAPDYPGLDRWGLG